MVDPRAGRSPRGYRERGGGGGEGAGGGGGIALPILQVMATLTGGRAGKHGAYRKPSTVSRPDYSSVPRDFYRMLYSQALQCWTREHVLCRPAHTQSKYM